MGINHATSRPTYVLFMPQHFHTIGLFGKPDHQGANETLLSLYQWLQAQNYRLLVEHRIVEQLQCQPQQGLSLNELGQQCDLVIVVGGDGNMLGAARVLAHYDVAVIGINRGKLGFLTDIKPDQFETQLAPVLAGEFDTEWRFLLQADIYRQGQHLCSHNAMNETVLHPGQVVSMLEFEVYINDKFMYSQRADGMIVSTPTGSTAYALSAGGAILSPNLDALILVPMFPHTLSARPIVIDGQSVVKLIASPEMGSRPLKISCDGHVSLPALPGDEIIIQRAPLKLRLIHPKGHNYFEVLRSKLGWGSKLF